MKLVGPAERTDPPTAPPNRAPRFQRVFEIGITLCASVKPPKGTRRGSDDPMIRTPQVNGFVDATTKSERNTDPQSVYPSSLSAIVRSGTAPSQPRRRRPERTPDRR